MNGLSAREVGTLKDLLKRVYDNLEKADRAALQPAAKARPAKKRVTRKVKVSA
jgi:hypothetical protein